MKSFNAILTVRRKLTCCTFLLAWSNSVGSESNRSESIFVSWMHDGSCMRCCYGVFLSSGAFTQVTLVSKQPSIAVFGNERIAYDCSRGWCVVGGRPARPQPLLLILESPKLEKGDLWSHNYKALTVWCNRAISSHSVRQKKKKKHR